MKNRIWIRILVCMALVLLALGGIICAQAEPDFFFKEHLKLTGLYDGETLTRVTSVPAYSRPSDSILYRSGSVSAPVEVVGAVKNTSDNIWWVTADGRYVWSGLKWNGSAFVSADGDTDDYALYSSSNGSVRVPNFSHTLRLSASSIPKGTSATISGTITADTAVTNVRILLKGTTVSGSTYQKEFYYNGTNATGTTITNRHASTSYFTRTSVPITNKLGSYTVFDTASLDYGTYQVIVTAYYGILDEGIEVAGSSSSSAKEVFSATFSVVDPSLYPTSLTANALSVKKGSTGQLSAKILPAGAAYTALTWSEVSDSGNCITLTSGGKVTANADGTARVRATLKWTEASTGTVRTLTSETTVTVYTLPEEPVISGAAYPTSLSNGQSFGLRGTITCKYPITEVRATVTNRITKAVVFNVAVNPNKTSYSIGNTSSETINNKLVFGNTALYNTYQNYKLTVKYHKDDGLIYTKVVLDKNFKVGNPTGSIPVESVTLSQTSATVQMGSILTLSATVLPSDAGNLALHWQSSNVTIAIVTQTGKVVPSAPGTVTIYCNAQDESGVRAECQVTVTCAHTYSWVSTVPATETSTGTEAYKCSLCGHISQTRTIPKLTVPVSSWTWTIDHFIIPLWRTSAITITEVLPENATNKTISFSSSDPSIATVSDTGVITPVSCGICVIWMHADGGSFTQGQEISVVDRLEGSCGNDLTWTLTQDGTLTISGTGDMWTNYSSGWGRFIEEADTGFVQKIIIREGVTGTSFYLGHCQSASQVIIEGQTLDYIDYGTFFYFSNLTELTLPDSVTQIGPNAFFGCANLRSLAFPEGLVILGESAVSECVRLETVVVPASVEHIGVNNFTSCGQMTILCDAETCAERYAQENQIPYAYMEHLLVGGLTWYYDNGTLTFRGNGAIPSYAYNSIRPWQRYASLITKLVLEEGVTAVGDFAFSNFLVLEEVTLPEGLLHIGNRAFVNDACITHLDLPSTLVSIGGMAFGRTRISEIHIPASLAWSNWPENPFLDTMLTAITVDPDNASLQAVDGVLFTKPMTFMLAYPSRKPDTAYAVPEGVRFIDPYAMSWVYDLEQVTLPSSLAGIGEYAFYCSPGLREAVISEGTTEIAPSAFNSCVNLRAVSLPETLLRIGDSAFSSCALQNVRIPASVTEFGEDVFNSCHDLRIRCRIGSAAQDYAEANGIPCTLLSPAMQADLILPADLCSIEEGALEGVPARSVLIPSGVGYVSSRAFADCANLSYVFVSGSTLFAEDAFGDRTGLILCGPEDCGLEEYCTARGFTFAVYEP